MQRYLGIEHRMEVTGDSTEYRTLFEECAPCDELAIRVDRIYAAGGVVRTKQWVLLDMAASKESVRFTMVAIRVRVPPTTFRESKGAPVESLPGGTVRYEFRLERMGPSWGVTAINRVVT